MAKNTREPIDYADALQRLADIRKAKTVRGDNHKPLSAKPLRVRY